VTEIIGAIEVIHDWNKFAHFILGESLFFHICNIHHETNNNDIVFMFNYSL